MFRLELKVDFSFDRSGTTGFKCSYLPGLFTRKSVDCLFRLVKKICHSTQLYLKLLLRIQHEVPFINTSEATKWSSNQTENGKCTNVTNCRIRVFYKILLSALRFAKPVGRTASTSSVAFQ